MPRDLFTARSESFGGGRSLEFEPTLMKSICVGGRPRPRRVLWKGLKKVVLFLLILGTVTGASLWYWGSGEERAVASMAQSTFDWLRDGSLQPFTVDAGHGGLGLDLLFGGSTVLAESTPLTAEGGGNLPEALALTLKLRDRFHGDLAAQGVDWTTAHPLAYGGVRAEVADADAPKGAVVALTGNLYFAAGDRVFALEFSAERIGKGFVPTDLWQCVALDSAPGDRDALRAHALACYEAFSSEVSAAAGETSPISSASPLFVNLS